MEDNVKSAIRDLQDFTNVNLGCNLHPVYDTEFDKIMFRANEIAEALGYSRPADAVAAHCSNSVKRRVTTISSNRFGSFERYHWATFIDESDVYRLIVNSKLPSARAFQVWLFEEVLPELRRTGLYVTGKCMKELMEDEHKIDEYAAHLKELREKRAEADKMYMQAEDYLKEISNTKAYVDGHHITYSIEDIANRLTEIGYDVGRNKLFALLRTDLRMLKDDGRSWNYPMHEMIALGYMVSVPTMCKDGMTRMITRITTDGYPYIVNKLIEFFESHPGFCRKIDRTPIQQADAEWEYAENTGDIMIHEERRERKAKAPITFEECGKLRKIAINWYVDHNLEIPPYLTRPEH